MQNDYLVPVSENSFIPALSTLVQRGVIAGAAYLGLDVSNDDSTRIASAIVVIGLSAWGAFRSWRSNEAKKRLEAQPAVIQRG